MRVEYNHPEFPKGMEMDIGGLLLVNGESVEVSQDQISFFEVNNGVTLDSALSSVQFVTVNGKKSELPVETTGDDSTEEGDN